MSGMIAATLAFIVGAAATYLFVDALFLRDRRWRQRLEQSAPATAVAFGDRGAAIPDTPPTADAQVDPLPTVTSWLSKSDLGTRLRADIIRAGLRLRPAEFVVICVGSVVFLALVGLILTHQIVMMLALGAIGFVIPLAILSERQEARRRRFDAQLPDALTLITSSLRSGYSFLRAIQMVADELPPPIQEEFAWVLSESNLGVPTETALQRLVDRVRSYDLDLVVTAVMIQLQVGGNLAEILDTIAETIRQRVRTQGDIKALTAEGRLSGIILFIMPIFLAIFIGLRTPDYFQPMLNSVLGRRMIGVGIVMQLIGGYIMKKMVDLDI